jgi:hypothetical protein
LKPGAAGAIIKAGRRVIFAERRGSNEAAFLRPEVREILRAAEDYGRAYTVRHHAAANRYAASH